jgi:phosphate uptake regulator
MEKRKIQSTGKSSFSVTLPKQWITNTRLGKDAIVELYELPRNSLLIRPAKTQHISPSRINIMYIKDSHLVRELIGMYVSGAEEIELYAKHISLEQRSLIRTTSYKLFGFELFEETSQRILLKNVATSIVSVDEYCKKMLDMIISMFHDLLIVLQTNDRKLAKDIVLRDIEIDRIHLIILRQFNTALISMIPASPGVSSSNLHFYEHVAIRLERLADHIVRIAKMFGFLHSGKSIHLNKFEFSRVKKLDAYFSLLKTTLFPVQKTQAHALLDLFETQPKNEHLDPKIITKSSVNIVIEDSTERIRSYIANIAEETINYTHLEEPARRNL